MTARMEGRGDRCSLVLVGAVLAVTAGCAPTAPSMFEQQIAGTTLRMRMVPLPGASHAGGDLWLGQTEVTWDLYDVFVHRLDEPPGSDADGITRPSPPYMVFDEGFGHAGSPVNRVSFDGAQAFCEWLTSRTGHRYRLPTLSEWRTVAAGAGDATWHRGNAGGTTHPVSSGPLDDRGLQDVLGNVAEWCVGPEGEGLLVGGSYLDEPDRMHHARPTESAWNLTDPQVPKSRWWLADAPFAGFRVASDSSP